MQWAAAGSDARMGGCSMPVVINSGSGNQGMTCSLPVLEYAKELHTNEDKTYRALALSNLIAIHQKTGIGRLSAYCGAVSAGAAAGAGIAYLCGGGYEEVIHTVVNALAIVSGMVCDGAKASCAAKIAASVDARNNLVTICTCRGSSSTPVMASSQKESREPLIMWDVSEKTA